MVRKKMNKEEDADVKKTKSGNQEVKVFFEEMDGLWIKMQVSSAKKAPGKEMKIETAFEGGDAGSVATKDENDKKESNALELKKYLENNKDKLLRYDERNLSISQPPKDVVYKGMGVQENQNATVIAMRMKHGRKRWKEHSANNMAKRHLSLCPLTGNLPTIT